MDTPNTPSPIDVDVESEAGPCLGSQQRLQTHAARRRCGRKCGGCKDVGHRGARGAGTYIITVGRGCIARWQPPTNIL